MWGNNSCNQTANKNSNNNDGNGECTAMEQDMDYTAEEVEEVDDDDEQ